MKRKLTLLLTAFLLLSGMRSWGQLRTEVSIDFSEQGYANAQDMDGVVIDIDENVTIVFNKASGSNGPKYYNTGTAIRAYGGNNFIVSCTETISSITLTFGTGDGSNEITTEVGSFESPTWTGSESEVTFTIGGTSGHRRIKAVAVTYGGGGQQQYVATPTFAPAAGTYYEAQEVSINCATEGATIRYTIDGNDPTENSPIYSSPINITETTTVKAFAMKEGYINSGIASATYTIAESPNVITIAEARALALNEYALVQGVVIFIDGRNIYIEDETAGIDLYLNTNTVPSNLALGDMVQAYGKRAAYNGLAELSGINGNDTEQFEILSSGNTLPLNVKTIAEILEGGADALQCTRVKVENAIIGAINTSGNTPLTQDGASINIYKVPALTDIEEGDAVDVIAVIGYFNTAQLRVASADDVVLVETPVQPDPELTVSVTELNDFRYIFGSGPSTAKNFTVSGTNLVSAVTLTAPQNFELSINPENGYYDNDELSPVDGTLAETTVYVRLKANLEPRTYSGNLTIVSETLSYNITLNGMVDEIPSSLTVSPSALYNFEYEYETGGPSEIQFFTVGGDHLTHNVSVIPSESFEVSTQPTALFQPENPAMIYIPNSGHFYGIKIYVRMKAGLEVGTYNEQIAVTSEDADTVFVSVAGLVTGNAPTPPDPPTPPTPGDGNYVRINDLSSLTAGSYIVFAARFDENATDYYAMSNASSGKPEGVLFTSATADENEVLPASIVDEESNYYWIVGETANGYTFTNANDELIGYISSTNFATNGDNTEWGITIQTSEEGAMVPNYTGFVIANVNNSVRAFALNSNHNFGPYHTQNMNGSGYNFYLDLFVKTEGGVPPTPTVATPTFTPAAGTYFETQTVSIACATDGATIYYSTISENGPWTAYSEAITVGESTTIWAYAEKEGNNDSNVAEATYIIQVGVVTIFNQDWEGEMNGWTFVDVLGEASWNVATYQGNHYAYANGYNHGANEDWCISPAFNLNAIGNPVLSFRTAKNYTGNDLEVFFSNDYDGDDPTAATWVPLTCALSSGSWTWVESGDIDLSSFSGSSCYIGFKYTCEESSAAGWEVDDIMLVGSTSDPVVTISPLALTGFSYVEGNGPSAEQSFIVSGLNLNENITIIDAPDFEISRTSGDDFDAQDAITLTPIGGNVEETTIYVRMKAGLAVGEYNAEVISITSEVEDYEVICSGNVTAQPVPGDDYVRISDVSQLADGNRIVFAARFDENANDYYAMSSTASGHPTGVLFTSTLNGSEEILPASILAEEDNFYWTVNVTADGYTFTNAVGDMIGYTSSTNFAPNGDNTAWSIEIGTSEETAMVPNYTGFVIANVNNPLRAFALNGSHNFGSYHTQNIAGENYNFFLDIFMQGEGGEPPTPTVAAPTFDPAGGTYYEAQNVTISCATEGATIYYSLVPEPYDWNEYEGPIAVDSNMTICAYAEKEGCNNSPVVCEEYIIQDDLVIIFNQDWEDDWNGWTEYCEMGDSLWHIGSHQGNHYAYANGYNHEATIDWLISPSFDLDSYSDVVLTFRTAMNYNGPDLEVLFSNDYDGQDPTTATWEPLFYEPSQGSWNWVSSGDISLDGFSGTNCYIGFRYTSTGNDNAAGWEVDDIMLTSGGSGASPTLYTSFTFISGFTYMVGEGPSASQSYTLTGANLEGEGDIIVTTSNGYFELSRDNDTFSSDTLRIPYSDGQLVETIYVRLAGGLEPGAYEDTITHQGGGATTEVSLAGTVYSEGEPMIQSEFVPLYIQGNNGSNNNRVPVATAVTIMNLEPNTTYRYTNQFIDENDGPETAGAGNVIYANENGFYRSTSPSLATEGGYGEFTTNENGEGFAWFINEPTANARFTPGNHVYLRIRINDGNDGTTVTNIFTTEDYATVLNFGNENDEYSGSAFYAKSDEAPMSFAMMYADNSDWRPIYSTPIETTGIDYGSINQYADFYKELVAGNDGWFGGILPNNNETGVNSIWIYDINGQFIHLFDTQDGQWAPDANTVNPTNGLDEPIFIDLTYDGVEETAGTNITVWSTGHEFVIENSDDSHYTMTVYNVLGQPMMQKQINASSTERIGHSLATGLYVISLQNNQNKIAVKVIVK